MARDFEVVGEVKIMGDVSVINNINQKLSQMNNTTNQGSGLFGKLGGAIQVALGNIGSRLFFDAVNGMRDLASETFNTIRQYEMMGLSLSSLAAREYLESDAVKAKNAAVAEYNKTVTAANKTASEGNQQALASYVTMQDAIAMTSDKAKELLAWTKQLALHSPFTMEQVNNAMRTMMAYGFTSKEAQRLTENVVNFTAATGRGSESVDRIALALGQITARGKLMGQELRQLTEAGVPAYDILQKMGFTLDDVRKGVVLAGPFMEAFSQTMEEDFGGAAERTLTTWQGLLSSFDDLKKIGMIELFSGISDAIKPFASELFNWLSSQAMLDKIHEWGTNLGTFATNVVNFVKAFPTTDFGKTLLDVLGAIKDFIQNPPSFADIKLDWESLNPDPALKQGVNDVILAFGNFKNSINQSAPEAKTAVSNFWTGILNAQKFALVQIKQDQSIYLVNAQESLATSLNTMSQIWSGHHTEVTGDATTFGGRMIQLYSWTLQSMAGVVMSGVTFISGQFQLGTALIQTFADLASNIAQGKWKKAWEDMKTDVNKVKDALQVIANWSSPMLMGMGIDIERLKIKWVDNWANMQIKIAEWGVAVHAWFVNAGSWFGTLAFTFQRWWDKLWTDAGIGITRLKNTISGKWSEIQYKFNQWVKDANTFGANFIDGIKKGFESKVKDFIASVVGSIKAAIQAAKDAAKMTSPSKVMMEMGGNLMEGLTLGITKNSASPASAMASAVGVLAGPNNYGGTSFGGITFNISGAGDPGSVADAIMYKLANELKLNGILTQTQSGRGRG